MASNTIYKFEQNQKAATPSANPKPTNINSTTNKTKEIKFDGKFRPRLIELTSFKPKLLIRFIIN